MIYHIISLLHNNLIKNGIIAEISIRIKEPTSILKKIVRKKLSLEELNDIIACRIIVSNKEKCYQTLDIVHTLYEHNVDKYKDFIRSPKKNGYQSIHTIIFVEKCKRKIEIQIRDLEMHNNAEFGEAAHSKYKYDKEKGLQEINCDNPLVYRAYKDLKQVELTERTLIAYEKAIESYLYYRDSFINKNNI